MESVPGAFVFLLGIQVRLELTRVETSWKHGALETRGVIQGQEGSVKVIRESAEPKKERLVVYLPPDLKRELGHFAVECRGSRSATIEAALRAFLKGALRGGASC